MLQRSFAQRGQVALENFGIFPSGVEFLPRSHELGAQAFSLLAELFRFGSCRLDQRLALAVPFPFTTFGGREEFVSILDPGRRGFQARESGVVFDPESRHRVGKARDTERLQSTHVLFANEIALDHREGDAMIRGQRLDGRELTPEVLKLGVFPVTAATHIMERHGRRAELRPGFGQATSKRRTLDDILLQALTESWRSASFAANSCAR